jgi:CPA1 family monovalent cation:H+ antiporter
MLDIAAICLVVTALLAYLNHRFVGLPTAIGVMVTALGCSLVIVGLDAVGISSVPRQYEESLLRSIDFSEVLMQGMLSLLLFAGALHIDLRELHEQRWTVGALALFGTLLSTAAVGYGMFFALPWVGLELPLVYCLLFGALISPTDPIAVMGILKSAGAPKRLELVIAGESLFNDGVGVTPLASMPSSSEKITTPTPSLKSDSPAITSSSSCGAPADLRMPITAIGSVGEINAPKSRQYTNGKFRPANGSTIHIP